MITIKAIDDGEGGLKPETELPQGVRVICDGTNYYVCETKDEETSKLAEFPSVKAIVDAQKPQAEEIINP